MEIDKDALKSIASKTSCEWTKGYIECLLQSTPLTYEESARKMAREIMDEAGPYHKIKAIKGIRAYFNLPLREAKAIVDEYFASGTISFANLQRSV